LIFLSRRRRTYPVAKIFWCAASESARHRSFLLPEYRAPSLLSPGSSYSRPFPNPQNPPLMTTSRVQQSHTAVRDCVFYVYLSFPPNALFHPPPGSKFQTNGIVKTHNLLPSSRRETSHGTASYLIFLASDTPLPALEKNNVCDILPADLSNFPAFLQTHEVPVPLSPGRTERTRCPTRRSRLATPL